MSFIIGRKGNFTSFLRDELRVHMQCYSDKNNRALKYDENIVVIIFSHTIFTFSRNSQEVYKTSPMLYLSSSRE